MVSAGNYGINPATGAVGYAGITSPGNAPSAITVGAVHDAGTTARGDESIARLQLARSDVVRRATPSRTSWRRATAASSAAGAMQTLYLTYPTALQDGRRLVVLKLSGTSMAAGVVSGTVALMIRSSRGVNLAPSPPRQRGQGDAAVQRAADDRCHRRARYEC